MYLFFPFLLCTFIFPPHFLLFKRPSLFLFYPNSFLSNIYFSHSSPSFLLTAPFNYLSSPFLLYTFFSSPFPSFLRDLTLLFFPPNSFLPYTYFPDFFSPFLLTAPFKRFFFPSFPCRFIFLPHFPL